MLDMNQNAPMQDVPMDDTPPEPQDSQSLFTLDASALGDSFASVQEGDPIQLNITGRVVTKNEDAQGGSLDIQIESAEPIGQITDRQAESMSSDELDNAIQDQMGANMKMNKPPLQ